ncbi:hypothetical protein BDQ17DRAFT_1401188 [Cyathus striatus]|nr:hypothetical protein BDQ17DRAFT_1401188 [Cyathus striatus]
MMDILCRLLHAANIPILIVSRSGTAPESFPVVRFDWNDPSTFSAPFEKAPSIDKVYLVGPIGALDMLAIAKPFIDLAIDKRIKKWVFVSASQSGKEGSWMGAIHQYLHDRGAKYTALRPTWFHENFSLVFGESIRKNEIATAAGDGRIPFVAVQDIAQAAFEALTTDEYKYAEPYIVGPELVTYDEAAAILSEVLGREITHKHLTAEEVAQGFVSIGLSEQYSNILAAAEKQLASGTEEKAFFTEGGKTVKYVVLNPVATIGYAIVLAR